MLAGQIAESARRCRITGQLIALPQSPGKLAAGSRILAAAAPFERSSRVAESLCAQRAGADAIADFGPAFAARPGGLSGSAAVGFGDAMIISRVDEPLACVGVGSAGDGVSADSDAGITGAIGEAAAGEGRFECAGPAKLRGRGAGPEAANPAIAARGVFGFEATPLEIGRGRHEEDEQEEHGGQTTWGSEGSCAA